MKSSTKRNIIKGIKIILAIITFPLHVVISGTMIWAWNLKEIMVKGIEVNE